MRKSKKISILIKINGLIARSVLRKSRKKGVIPPDSLRLMRKIKAAKLKDC